MADEEGKEIDIHLQESTVTEEIEEDEDIGDYIPTPPDGGFGWVIVICSFMCNVIVDGIGYAYGVLLPEFANVFNASRSKVSLVGSLLCGVYLCAGPIVSGLTNRFGCRPVAITGSIIAAIGFFIGSFSPSLDVLIITYGVLGGFGFGLIYLPSIVSVGYYFEKKRALATGIAVCGSGVGTFIFSPVNNKLLGVYMWRGLLMIHAGVILQCAICGMLMRPLQPPKKPKKKRTPSIIDKAKEKAKSIGRNRGESESSVAVTEAFAKLREAKLNRENKLNECDSDISSMPSAYFVKGVPDTMSESRDSRQMKLSFSEKGDTPAMPSPAVEPPKILVSENGSTQVMNANEETPTSNISTLIPDATTQEDNDTKDNGTVRNRKSADFPTGVFGHEVQPLIENGYTKDLKKQSHAANAADSKLKVGSYRDVAMFKEDYKRPLYRKDIFYSGSVLNIPQYKSQPDVRSYVASITSIPGDMGEEIRSSIFDRCTCLPKSVVDTLKEMLDISLMTNISFLMLCVGNIFGMIGFYVPFTYVVDRAVLLGIDSGDAAFLLSVIGITNTIGRVLSGFLADLKHMDALVINNVALVIAAISLFLEPLCVTFTTLIVFAAIYGLAVAAYISLTSIILCDLLGLEKLTNAFGLLTMARGIAGIVGPPLAGMVFQAYGSYDASFIMGGIMFSVGALFHFSLHLPYCRKYKLGARTIEHEMEGPGEAV